MYKEKESIDFQQELNINPFRSLEISFALMSLLPFLALFYLLVTTVLGFDILAGFTGLIVLVSLIVSLIGYYLSYKTIQQLMKKLVVYAMDKKKDSEAKRRLISSISHEVRNPLSVLMVNLVSIKKGHAGNINEEQKVMIEMCYKMLTRINNLVNMLLYKFKLESGLVKIEKSNHNINEVIKEMEKEYLNTAEAKNFTLLVETDQKIGMSMFDKDKMIEVLHNLMSNAIKFIPVESGRICLRTKDLGSKFCVECENNGPLINDEDKGSIFDEFRQLDKSKKGLGLGLAISKEIIKRHKGTIRVDDGEQGCMFIVEMPKTTEEDM